MAHEYPDPDYAAYLTKYPWVGGEAGLIQLEVPDHRDEFWRRPSHDNSGSDASRAIDPHIGELTESCTGPLAEADRADPDYQVSGDIVL